MDIATKKAKPGRNKKIKRVLDTVCCKVTSCCAALLHFFSYEVPNVIPPKGFKSLVLMIIFPFLTLGISLFILDQTEIGLLLVLFSVLYKFILSEYEYDTYRKQFSINGNEPKPPVNPHQMARGAYLLAVPLIVIVFILHFIYQQEITLVGAKFTVGGIGLLLSLIQDLSTGVACVFEADYPQPDSQFGQYTGG